MLPVGATGALRSGPLGTPCGRPPESRPGPCFCLPRPEARRVASVDAAGAYAFAPLGRLRRAEEVVREGIRSRPEAGDDIDQSGGWRVAIVDNMNGPPLNHLDVEQQGVRGSPDRSSGAASLHAPAAARGSPAAVVPSGFGVSS